MEHKETDKQVQMDRIRLHEQELDRCSEVLARLSDALSAYVDTQPALRSLDAYYGSSWWFADKEAQESGAFPADLKCGVLSEDAVFDMLSDNKELCVAMAEILAALKKR